MKLECYIKKHTKVKKLWIINNPNAFIEQLENNKDYSVGNLL